MTTPPETRMSTDEELLVTSDIGTSSGADSEPDAQVPDDDWPVPVDLPPLTTIPTRRTSLRRQDATLDLLSTSRRRDNKMSKYWCVTENDPTGIVEMMSWFETATWPEGVDYAVGQVESGTHGKTHMQGYIETTIRRRLAWLKKHVSSTAHWERRRGTAREAIAYCKKEETRINGPFEYGEPNGDHAGKRNDLLEAKKQLDTGMTVAALAKDDAFFASCARNYKFFDWYTKHAGLKNPPRTKENIVEVLLLIGEAGTGKTRHAAEQYPDAYWKPSQSKWWDGYQGEKTVVFDDFNHGWFTWDTFMRIIDRYPLKVEYKGGHVDFCATTMVLTSNTHPRYWYKNMGNRWPALQRRITRILHFTIDEEPQEISLERLFHYGEPVENSAHYS